MGYELASPVNTTLALLIVYVFSKILFPAIPDKEDEKPPSDYKTSYNWLPAQHPPSVVYKTYTPKTLEPFNGTDNERILLAIKGTVFDVTAGKNFYGPDGPYGNFAGRDASRGMAKQSFDTEMLTPLDQPLDKLEDLTPAEIDNMNGWFEHFSHKYIVCGTLVDG